MFKAMIEFFARDLMTRRLFVSIFSSFQISPLCCMFTFNDPCSDLKSVFDETHSENKTMN